jgi:uncharacterized membrane protein YsdA (DUF1294 family)
MLQKCLLFWLLALSILTFTLYGIDKYKAIRHKWRIPETTLIAAAFLGGAPGALLGMACFHHKTRKWKFRILVPLALIVWIMAAGFVLGFIPGK